MVITDMFVRETQLVSTLTEGQQHTHAVNTWQQEDTNTPVEGGGIGG